MGRALLSGAPRIIILALFQEDYELWNKYKSFPLEWKSPVGSWHRTGLLYQIAYLYAIQIYYFKNHVRTSPSSAFSCSGFSTLPTPYIFWYYLGMEPQKFLCPKPRTLEFPGSMQGTCQGFLLEQWFYFERWSLCLYHAVSLTQIKAWKKSQELLKIIHLEERDLVGDTHLKSENLVLKWAVMHREEWQSVGLVVSRGRSCKNGARGSRMFPSLDLISYNLTWGLRWWIAPPFLNLSSISQNLFNISSRLFFPETIYSYPVL